MSKSSHAIPRATYRLQLHAGFGFEDAAAVGDYLAELGVSHVYTSPVLAAAAGSTHGYDVVDHEQVNPELGGASGLKQFERVIEEAGLGWVLDIVPNHMAIHTPANRTFWDVLEHGRDSVYAAMFDIDWNAPQQELKGRVLLPILGQELAAVMEEGQLQVLIDKSKPVLAYYDHRMPLSPGSLAQPIQETAQRCNKDPMSMRGLLARQHYLPAYWRQACTQINYRRFFTINSLIGLRVEEPEVFDRVHALPLAWIRDGKLDGLRIDHPDGLRDPTHYLERLRQAAPKSWLLVEKILEPEEHLPADWPVDGTTGYDTLNVLSGLFVDPQAEAAMTQSYRDFTGRDEPFEAAAQQGKRDVMAEDFGGEIDRLVRLLCQAGLDAAQARAGVIELAVHWPVYRVYPDPEAQRLDDVGRERVWAAIHNAAEHTDLDPVLWEKLSRLLTLEEDAEYAIDFSIRFQQLASAVTAKGVEDTAFYRYYRLVSLNEVGGDPGRFGTPVDRFHSYVSKFNEDWPGTMTATTTHDTKRSEDTRLRIAMLSQMPDRWSQVVQDWSEIAESHRDSEGSPTREDEYLFYQTLIGTWPIGPDRLKAFMLKAAREAKERTNWIDQDTGYEAALTRFVDGLITDDRLIKSLESLLTDLLPAARVASLAQTLIKLTLPGVPDIYQGCELWEESLVDPDNRRPVDFDRRRAMLKELDGLSPADILSRMNDGLPKLWVTRQALSARREHRECFEPAAAYEPITANGSQPDRVVAYRRGQRAITVVPRLTVDIDAWSGQTAVRLPAGRWRDVMSGRMFESEGIQATIVADLWGDLPLSLLIQEAS